MFTGIIESVGQINSLKKINSGCELIVEYNNSILNDIALGDSVSVNGICLTVTKFDEQSLRFDLSNETISRMSKIRVGDKNHNKVNGSTLMLLTKGEKIKVKGTTKSKFLLISGKPIGEPIARGGPFVMNTKQEILQAVEDYHSGNFVQK